MNLVEATALVRYLAKREVATAILTQFEEPARPGDPPHAEFAVMIPRESLQRDLDVSDIAYGTWLRGFKMIFNPRVNTFVFEKGQALLAAPMEDPDDPPVEAEAFDDPLPESIRGWSGFSGQATWPRMADPPESAAMGLCPVCNAVRALTRPCPHCGHGAMKNAG